MSGFSFITFVLIAVSCYALSSSKTIRIEHQATKKVDLPNHIGGGNGGGNGVDNGGGSSLEAYTNAHQIPHALLRDEARPKRSERDVSEYKDLNSIIEDLEESALAQAAAVAQDFDFESMPPLTYYLLLQKLKQLQSNEPTYRVRTPRLGRSIDFQLLDAAAAGDVGEDFGAARQFVSRVNKKSVPFKPRLGKRGQQCD